MTHDDAEAAIARAPLDSGDHRLLSGVRELFSLVDPPPASLADSIKFELTLAALHAEVAELEQLSFVGLREDRVDYVPTESVTFTSSSLSLMVTVSPEGDPATAQTVRVDGWVTEGGTAVELRVGGASVAAVADENGRFVLERVPRGPARFVLRREGGERPVITPSIEV
jgi:hypothetical protein